MDKNGNSPLHIAAYQLLPHAIEALLALSFDPQTPNKMGQTALTIVTSGLWNEDKRLNSIHLLLKVDSKRQLELINTTDKQGCSPLWHACNRGYSEIVDLLLEKLDSVLHDQSDDTLLVKIKKDISACLWVACNNGFETIVKKLLTAGADPTYVSKKDGTSCIAIAIAKNHTHVLQLFEKKYRKDSRKLRVMLREYIKFGKHEAIDKLVKTHEKQLKTVIEKDETCLKYAVQSGCAVTVQKLLDLGAKKTPKVIALAAERGEHEMFPDDEKKPPKISAEESSHFPRNRKFQVFNDKVEEDWWQHDKKIIEMKKKHKIELGDLKKYMLDLCLNLGSKEKDMTLRECQYQNKDCKHIGEKRDNCERTQDLLEHSCKVEDFLRNHSKLFKSLKPCFKLIGSIAEGTRIGRAVEVDITIDFLELKNCLEVDENDPRKIKVIDENKWENLGLSQFIKEETTEKLFDSPKFLQTLLEELELAMKSITPTGKLSFMQIIHGVPHHGSTEPKFENSHCKKHLPFLTHTKIGPCLVLSWGHKDIVTIDLIPVFHVTNKSCLPIMRKTLQMLVEKRPKGWLKYFQGIIERDRILPDMLTSESDMSEGGILVAVKRCNCVDIFARGAPRIVIKELEGQIKLAYQYVKVLKDILELDIKSYFVKKFLLRPEFKNIGEKTAEEILIEIMSHAEFKQKFEKAIEFEEGWEDEVKKGFWWNENDAKQKEWVTYGTLRLKQKDEEKQSTKPTGASASSNVAIPSTSDQSPSHSSTELAIGASSDHSAAEPSSGAAGNDQSTSKRDASAVDTQSTDCHYCRLLKDEKVDEKFLKDLSTS